MTDNITPYTFDDDIIAAAHAERSPKIKIYCLDKTAVVIGKGGKPEKELQLDAIEAENIDVYRRYGGGCTVVIDPGNVIISVVIPASGIASHREYFNVLTEWVRTGLAAMGFTRADLAGTSDIAIGGKKISGSCIYSTKDYLYYSATLLFDPDTALMDRLLKHPPREPEYRKNRGHSDFLTSLRNETGAGGIEDFIAGLKHHLNQAALTSALGTLKKTGL